MGWNVCPQHVMNLQRANEWIYSNLTVSELITAATGRPEVQVGRDARRGGCGGTWGHYRDGPASGCVELRGAPGLPHPLQHSWDKPAASRAALGRDLNFSFQFHVPFPNRGPGAASYHLGWCSADKGALEIVGESSFSMHMYIGAESAAKVNTTLPFPKMSSRNCKGSWSKKSVSDTFCFLLGGSV